MSEEPWYVTAFTADYRAVYPHRDLASARTEVAWLLEQGLAGRVLDLCCGFGRHALALLEAGLDVAGVDLSLDLLRGAAELPGGSALRERLVRADARSVPFVDGAFDGLVNLFSSFGYFGEQGDARVLGEVARLVRPGGLAVLDLMNPARIRAGLVPESRRERDGMVLVERRALEDQGRRVTKVVCLTLPDGREKTWREDVRMYEPNELRSLLGARGMLVERVAGGFDGRPFEARSERQLVLARRGAIG
jgi:SAM-dependent methyltransferase